MHSSKENKNFGKPNLELRKLSKNGNDLWLFGFKIHLCRSKTLHSMNVYSL